jgi:Ni,Fe-hydrogenase III large subunit
MSWPAQITPVTHTLAGLWGEKAAMHAAFIGPEGLQVVTLPCPDRSYPALSPLWPGAARLERAARDLYGLEARGAADTRPWLDHGKWPSRPDAAPYRFLPVDGESVHQIPVGPVHAGIIEPGHFRFHANGETVVRLEERLGYVHKGTERLAAGADIARAAKLAARVSGDSTVAYSFAFARAAEAAAGIEVPARAHLLRALMAELERIANHFGDIGAICNDAAFSFLHMHHGVLRERVLRACAAAFGHRLMMDVIVPGGVTHDLDAAAGAEFRQVAASLRHDFRDLMRVYDDKPSLQHRTVSTGFVPAALVSAFGAGGYVGRASGRAFDGRKNLPYPPYDQLSFAIPVREDGDVHARLMIRAHEVEQSLGLIEQIIDRLRAPGPIAVPFAPRAGVGVAVVESFRGDVLVWLRIGADGRIERMHPRDPSWFQWPLLEAAIEGNIVADFPLCNKSFNCSYSGVDL